MLRCSLAALKEMKDKEGQDSTKQGVPCKWNIQAKKSSKMYDS